MKIIGYSERGAMNALFYGMALDSDKIHAEKMMNLFLCKAGINETYTDFCLYNEPELSQFGSCDLIITASRGDGRVAFFVEAKVSTRGSYHLGDQLKDHENMMEKKSSNLFYQLREKYELMTHKPATTISNILGRKVKSIGKSEIVKYLHGVLCACQDYYYIALIPKQKSIPENLDRFGFSINVVFWEDLIDSHGCYLSDTLNFNEKGGQHQILNKTENANKKDNKTPLGKLAKSAYWQHDSISIIGDRLECFEVIQTGKEPLQTWRLHSKDGPISLIDNLLAIIFPSKEIPDSCNEIIHDLIKALGATLYHAIDHNKSNNEKIESIIIKYDSRTSKAEVQKLCDCVGIVLNGGPSSINGFNVQIQWK